MTYTVYTPTEYSNFVLYLEGDGLHLFIVKSIGIIDSNQNIGFSREDLIRLRIEITVWLSVFLK